VIHYLQQRVLDNEEHPGVGLENGSADGLEQLVQLGCQVLEWGDFQARWDVAKLLPRFGERVIPALLALLCDREVDPESQWFAIRLLGECRQPHAITTLSRYLYPSTPPDLQQAAVSALGQIGVAALPALEPLLQSAETRLLASQVLAQIRQPQTVPYLLELARDEAAPVRSIAVAALGSFHSRAVATTLLAALQDYSAQVRRAALAGVGFCAPDLPEVDWVSPVAPLVQDVDLGVCQQAILVLGRLQTEGAIRVLAQTLQSPYLPEPLALEVLRTLAWTETELGLQQIQLAWHTLPLSLRAAIGAVLGRLERPALQAMTAEMLQGWLEQDAMVAQVPRLRQTLALALGQLGHRQALNSLIALLADPDRGVQLHAVAALKQLDANLARQHLQALSSTQAADSPLGQGIQLALQEW
jgi:HEAT repeat protein